MSWLAAALSSVWCAVVCGVVCGVLCVFAWGCAVVGLECLDFVIGVGLGVRCF